MARRMTSGREATRAEPSPGGDDAQMGPAVRRPAKRGISIPSSPRDLVAALENLKLGRFAGLFLLAGLIILFGLWIPQTFLTLATLRSILENQSITLMLSLSLMICLTTGVFDISIGQNLGLGTIICLQLISQHGWNPALASLVAVVVCTSVGVLNAALVVYVGIDSFIATLGTSSIVFAVAEILSGSVVVGPASLGFQNIISWQPLGIPILIIYALALALIVWYVLEHTPLGRRLNATGANPEAARLAGVPTRRYLSGAFVATAFGAGVTSVLLSAEAGSVVVTDGQTYLLPVFAVCFLAATQIKPGRYNVGGLLVALFLLGTGVEGLGLIGDKIWIPDLFNGLALTTAVGLTVVVQRRQTRRAKRRAAVALRESSTVASRPSTEENL
jgi:ribose transport system permease protein